MSALHWRWVLLDLALLATTWPFFVWGRSFPPRVAFACAFAVGALSFLARRAFNDWLELYRQSRSPPFEIASVEETDEPYDGQS